MANHQRPKPVVLCVMDGWGWREEREHNAILQAETPHFDRLWARWPHAFLDASEEHVGLPAGQMGNSEVGHMNLGAGRVVFQDLPMIDRAIAAGDLDRNPALQDVVAKLKQSGGRCHLLGLVSAGGVHSHQDHILALARMVAGAGVGVVIHAFLDGRDVPPKDAAQALPAFLQACAAIKGVTIGTVGGRYYAMDRDKRWERVARAYDAMVEATGAPVTDIMAAVRAAHAADTGDEFVSPFVVAGYTGMKDGDGVLCANFRADRARQILAALADPGFDGYERGRVVQFAAVAGMVEYSSAHAKYMTTLFPPKDIRESLGEVVAAAGLTQLRIAETEKYPHVTFFFNGGQETVYAGEERILVPSPKVATYDLAPAMSADEVTDKVVAAIDAGAFDLIVINYANSDMVGHTGILPAAVKAIEAVDRSVGRLEAAVMRAGGVLFLTADHGNSEQMYDPATNGPHTAHTLNRVPAILINAPGAKSLRDGKLADVAPTLLHLLHLPQPVVMDGRNLMVV